MAMNPELLMEDAITTYQGLVQDVDRSVMNAALRGRISRDSKRHAVYKLERAIQAIQQMPEN